MAAAYPVAVAALALDSGMTSPQAPGAPDPRKSLYIFASGKKGTGKSHLCRSWFDSYPLDKLVIDVTHDVRRDFQNEGVKYTEIAPDMMPTRLPFKIGPHGRDEPQIFVACPDMGSAEWQDDIDRVVGLCLGNGRPMLLWVDEFGAITSGAKTRPNMRRVLHHGRHDDLSLLLACPRPIDVDVLGIAQADLVYTFRTPNHYDRERIADNIGWPRDEFDTTNRQLQGHEHTLFDARTDELMIMPPLPPRNRGAIDYVHFQERAQ